MDFDLTSDQNTIQAAIDQLIAPHRTLPAGLAPDTHQPNATLERDLVASGFLDLAREEGYGPLEALLLIEACAQLPYAIEVGASALVAPMLGLRDLPRPLALVDLPLSDHSASQSSASHSSPPGPIRFAAPGGTVLIDTGAGVRRLDLEAEHLTPLHTPFAYPYSRIETSALARAPLLTGVSAAALRQWWQLALAGEITGALQAALDITVGYVKERRQFNRPIGSFQVVQQRLSECATVVHGARMLARRAAWSARADDAALAAAYAQQAIERVVYDTQQFHGAMGLTLEYPLHYWTLRLRALQGELGGTYRQAERAAELVWTSTEKP